jgi:hypothetical protein
MSLFGPKSKEYGDLNRQSILELQETTEEVKEEVQVIQSAPFAGSDPGLVPASNDDTQAKFLRGDGAWATPAGGGGGTSDYEDLANKPAIDGTTLDKNSTAEGLGLAKSTDIPDVSEFVTDDDLKEYAKKTDIPTVPSKTSDLTNDSGFITGNDIPSIPSKTSDLTNDSGFITSETDPTVPSWAKQPNPPTVPTKTSDLQNDSGFLTSETDPTVPSWAKQQNPPTPATFDGEHAGLVPAPASGDSGKYLKADGTWATPSGGGGGASTLDGLTDVDLTNPSNGQILVYNATEGKWKNGAAPSGGGGVGSMFEIETTLTELLGTTVTVTDSKNNTWTGTFDNEGVCIISGISSIGNLRISFESLIDPITQVVESYSYYFISANYIKLDNVNWATAIAPINALITKGRNRYAGFIHHFKNYGAAGCNTWYTNSSSFLSMRDTDMTSQWQDGTYTVFNNALSFTNTGGGDYTTVTFLVPGYAIFGPSDTPINNHTSESIFSVDHFTTNDTLSLNPDPATLMHMMVVFYPDI